MPRSASKVSLASSPRLLSARRVELEDELQEIEALKARAEYHTDDPDPDAVGRRRLRFPVPPGPPLSTEERIKLQREPEVRRLLAQVERYQSVQARAGIVQRGPGRPAAQPSVIDAYDQRRKGVIVWMHQMEGLAKDKLALLRGDPSPSACDDAAVALVEHYSGIIERCRQEIAFYAGQIAPAGDDDDGSGG